MLVLIDEMKEGPEKHPHLAQMFEKARENLLRQTKNFRMEFALRNMQPTYLACLLRTMSGTLISTLPRWEADSTTKIP